MGDAQAVHQYQGDEQNKHESHTLTLSGVGP